MRAFTVWVAYLKVVTVLIGVMSVVALVTRDFDPSGYLGDEVLRALTGTPNPPESTLAPFRFVMGLFALLSVIVSIMQYGILHYAFARRERWAYGVIAGGWIVWIVGAGALALVDGVRPYLELSVLAMAILFLPPIIGTSRYFR